MAQEKTQSEQDIDYLLTQDHYLRVLKQLESRRESAIAQFSAGLPTNESMNQLAGEIRAVNETMGALGYFKAREMTRFRQM